MSDTPVSEVTPAPPAEDAKAAVKPAATTPADQTYLNIKVRSAEPPVVVFFKVKPSTAIKKVIDSFCARTKMDSAQLRFIFEGKRVAPNETPEQLGMKDDDEIDVMVTQHGGWLPSS